MTSPKYLLLKEMLCLFSLCYFCFNEGHAVSFKFEAFNRFLLFFFPSWSQARVTKWIRAQDADNTWTQWLTHVPMIGHDSDRAKWRECLEGWIQTHSYMIRVFRATWVLSCDRRDNVWAPPSVITGYETCPTAHMRGPPLARRDMKYELLLLAHISPGDFKNPHDF